MPIINTNHLILLNAAKNLAIKTQILSVNPPKIKYTHKNKSHIISEKSFGLNRSPQAKKISRNKSLALKTLQQAGLPVPRHTVIYQRNSYKKACQKHPFPQVIKPLYGEKGKSVYLNIQNHLDGRSAIQMILEHYPSGAIVETYHQGNDYRFLVLNGRLIGLAQRLPPTITGDGKSTIKQLIDAENRRRLKLNQQAGRRLLNRMRRWSRISFNLHLQGLSLKVVLPQGKTINLYPIPNFSTGGSVKTINPQSIHPSFITLAETAAQTIGLEICGIDMLIQNLHSPAAPNNAVIIEVNSDPGLRLHDWPNQGQSQHTAEKILQHIFKENP